MSDRAFLVSGTSSVLGQTIADRLALAGHAVTRAARSADRDEAALALDLTNEAAVRRVGARCHTAVLCPILSTSAPAVRWLAEEGVKRFVVFSSNNVSIDETSPVYSALREAEALLSRIDASVTILRPTMIYGYPGDGNLSRLVAMARRFGALPCPGAGQALQQPVFVTDVAESAILAATDPSFSGTYTVGGPDVITTRALFAAVLEAAGRNPERVLPLSLTPLRIATSAAGALGLPWPLTRGQLERVEQHKTVCGASLPNFTPQVGIAQGLAQLVEAMAPRHPS